jgi:hypothetical protein
MVKDHSILEGSFLFLFFLPFGILYNNLLYSNLKCASGIMALAWHTMYKIQISWILYKLHFICWPSSPPFGCFSNLLTTSKKSDHHVSIIHCGSSCVFLYGVCTA